MADRGKPGAGHVRSAGERIEDMVSIVTTLAENVRALRESHGLTLSQLSERSGVAKATLFKVERERTNATIGTIEAIAETFKVPVATLIATSERAGVEVVRQGEGQNISDDSSIGFILSSQRIGQGRIEIHSQRFLAGKSETSASHGSGTREHVLVREGIITVGPVDETVTLNEGDYATYRADRMHKWQAIDADASVWIIHTYPVASGPGDL